MTRFSILLVGCAALFAWQPFAAAQDSSPAEVLRGAIDPYSLGSERTRFLRAAGVDSELSEDEFKKNRETSGGFARVFDKFSTILLFDKNKNKQVDWFEASAYRGAVRAAVLAEYDKDGNRKLTGPEREAANRDLAAGKLPRISADKSSSSGRPSTGAARPAAPPSEPRVRSFRPSDAGSPAEARRREWEALQSRLAKKYDKNGNGRIDGREEWREAGPEVREYYRKREIERFDSDGDGKVSDAERRAGRERDIRANLRWQHDKDRDGELTGDEREAYDKAMRNYQDQAEHGEVRRQVFMNRFDRDRDGELSEAERAEIGPFYERVREEAKRSAVKQFDQDGDGELSQEERDAGRKAVEQMGLKQFDADGDGELSVRERTAAMRKDPVEAERLFHLYMAVAGPRSFGQGGAGGVGPARSIQRNR